MPELPEVETMRRGLACVVGRRIAAVEFPRSRVRPIDVTPRPTVLAARLAGRSIAAVHRRGKRVVLELIAPPDAGDDTLWLAIEPRMTGLMLVAEPPSIEHVRMVVRLAPRRGGPGRFLFWDRRGLGTVRLLDARGLDAVCGREKLGVDGLAITGADLAAALGRSRRAVKVALLDQRAVAGIGNIYAAEILFHAGIDPRTPCRRLRGAAWDAVAAAARAILAAAVRLEGSSIGDETYRTVEARVGRYQKRHRVYGRAGEPCAACGTTIERIVQAQRSTFWCPVCQHRTPRRG
ncbi:MAG: bifunctional DNA-formamidopyrimidine glycosylase/DNA-(apurinic or apyrimidinic site) lyase [Planctomycetaceae bacterium]